MIRKGYDILKAYKDKDEGGLIVHSFPTAPGTRNELWYAAVCGGLTWPTNESPGHFIVLGSEWDGKFHNPMGKNPKPSLYYLAEYTQPDDDFSLETLLEKIKDIGFMLCCESWFGSDFHPREKQYRLDFQKYMFRTRKPRDIMVTFQTAPFCESESFFLGQQFITDFIKDDKLDVPEYSKAAQQASLINRGNIMPDPEKRFFALNSLRHVVSAFHTREFRPMVFKKDDGPKTWMGVG